MNILSTLLGLFLIIVPGSALFISIRLCIGSNGRKESLSLALFLSALAIEVLHVFTRDIAAGKLFSQYLLLNLHLLLGPLILFYTQRILGHTFISMRKIKILVIQWLPFTISSAFSLHDLAIIISGSPENRLFLAEKSTAYISFNVIFLFQFFCCLILSTVITVLSFRRLKRAEGKIKPDFKWIAVLLAWSFAGFTFVLLDNLSEHDFYFFCLLSICALVIHTHITMIRYPELFSGTGKAQTKYRTTLLPVHLVRQYISEIESAIEQEHIFTDPALTLSRFAGHLNMAPHHLSQIINTHYGENFSRYINRMRVNHAMDMFGRDLECNKNILTIALESGFNSKTSFNIIFKQLTGQTPGEYRRTLKSSSNSAI